MTLSGPADADRFRVKEGRYGERWYVDPLPACDIAEATDDRWPAISTIKKAAPKFLDNWIAKNIAEAAVDHQRVVADLDRAAAVEFLSGASKRATRAAADRGTAVHAIVDALVKGEAIPTSAQLDGADYIAACRKLVDNLQPESLANEVVAISRKHRTAGTADHFWKAHDAVLAIDVKSRGLGKHGAYTEDAAQVAFYAGCDYLIVEENGVAVRRPVPNVDHLLIISIDPEGYRLYPIDFSDAFTYFEALRTWWQESKINPVGRPVDVSALRPVERQFEVVDIPSGTATNAADLVDWLRTRGKAIAEAGGADAIARQWPTGVPKLAELANVEQVDAVAALFDRLEAELGVPFGANRPGQEKRTPAADLVLPLDAA